MRRFWMGRGPVFRRVICPTCKGFGSMLNGRLCTRCRGYGFIVIDDPQPEPT
jgi:DnaJ-class molecular chaperone